MKEGWSLHTIKSKIGQPTLIDFKHWLKDKADAHEKMKTASGKTKVDENTQPGETKTKATSRVFAATTSTNKRNANSNAKSDIAPTTCVACK